MSIHINAEAGKIAPTVLFPGDPLRAKYFAEKYLENPETVSDLRGMYCLSGEYKGKRVSFMGSGMGQASLSIYANELYRDYGVEQIIRIGSCGSIQEHVKVNQIILAQGACTNGNMNRRRFNNLDFAAISDFTLLSKAYTTARDRGLDVHVGNILSTDSFYDSHPEEWKLWASYAVLGIEMESAELYTLAASYGKKALSILTVSDSLLDSSHDILQDREKGMGAMAELALALA
ncbi:purine-nucleoside phosphorylase [Salinispira pacifica]|uniref:Uridine phosphorylase n=1 Tax=Salinispira pacifica TaxID=1307761 RepID=V5WFT7_9SPIO|nr:purine-nucleoside phosphorylase [Salinispira pacifica]AHC14692.1 Purine nucleoside phosphorylase [Salinispira pacifica]